MTILPKGDWSIPGTWVPHQRDDNSDGAIVLCAKCGRGATTQDKIDVEGYYHGLLMSRFVCPYVECGWSDDVKFLWWNRKTVSL